MKHQKRIRLITLFMLFSVLYFGIIVIDGIVMERVEIKAHGGR